MKSKYMQTNLARPYAKAAYEFALAERALAVWSDGLNLAALIVTDPDAERFFENPQQSFERHLELIFSIQPSAWTASLQNFMHLLAEKGRLSLVPSIAQLFEVLRAEHDKITEVQVYSAFPLSSEQQQRVQIKLKQRLQGNIHLNCHIDKGLLGGYLIRAGDLVIDASLRGRVTRLNYVLRDQQL
jgi:F-type H+-transporting ATPase subunit delta